MPTTPSTTTSTGTHDATVIVACPSCATRFRYRPAEHPDAAHGSCSKCSARFQLAPARALYRVMEEPSRPSTANLIASIPIRPATESDRPGLGIGMDDPTLAERVMAPRSQDAPPPAYTALSDESVVDEPIDEVLIPDPDPADVDSPAPASEVGAPDAPSISADDALAAFDEVAAEIPTPEGGVVTAVPSLDAAAVEEDAAAEDVPAAELDPVERARARGTGLRKLGTLALPGLAVAAAGYYAAPMIPEAWRVSSWLPQGVQWLGSEANLTAAAGGVVGLCIGVALTVWLSRKS